MEKQRREAVVAARAAKRAAEAKTLLARVTSKRAASSGKVRKACRCGSTTHSRTNHRDCPLRVRDGVARSRLPQTARVRAQIAAIFENNGSGASSAAAASADAGATSAAAASGAAAAAAAAAEPVAGGGVDRSGEAGALAALESLLPYYIAAGNAAPLRSQGVDSDAAALATLLSVLPPDGAASAASRASARGPHRVREPERTRAVAQPLQKKQKNCCRCGSTAHRRTSHRDCRLNSRRQRAPTAAAAIEGGSDEASALAELERLLPSAVGDM